MKSLRTLALAAVALFGLSAAPAFADDADGPFSGRLQLLRRTPAVLIPCPMPAGDAVVLLTPDKPTATKSAKGSTAADTAPTTRERLGRPTASTAEVSDTAGFWASAPGGASELATVYYSKTQGPVIGLGDYARRHKAGPDAFSQPMPGLSLAFHLVDGVPFMQVVSPGKPVRQLNLDKFADLDLDALAELTAKRKAARINPTAR